MRVRRRTPHLREQSWAGAPVRAEAAHTRDSGGSDERGEARREPAHADEERRPHVRSRYGHTLTCGLGRVLGRRGGGGPCREPARPEPYDGDRVHTRWIQNGRHVGPVDHHLPTGAQVTAMTSEVHRVEHGRIVEYWIQFDRQGITVQLRQTASEL
ncbi:ester cyclase [Streptomyces sp. NBC_00683]|uniref:ester cyclase n=1 Tax=Streptomyces sp. NBC_00683 TaxID=2903670 RepID=UPI002E34895B|nr:ester cyclase [Streptomyces sp. NBC_00683]